jgi:virginiamycin B lyase
MKEYSLPGPSPTPYGLAIDKYGRIWYSSDDQDTMGCLDPKTGAVVEYPTPYPENGMRDIYTDTEGRIWFSTPPNNKVGYFVPPPPM